MAEEEKTDAAPPAGFTSIMSRPLQSFPEPDMEVLVGPNQKIYKYHGIMLASHSNFFDVVLSSPAAVRIQEKHQVAFPDIDEVTWEMMIALLEPGASLLELPSKFEFEMIPGLLSFYHKYEFHTGIALLDALMSTYFKSIKQNFQGPSKVEADLICIAVEFELPKSMEPAMALAKERVQSLRFSDEKSLLEQLLPLVEHEEEILLGLASLLHGRKAKNMSLDEIRREFKQPDYAKRLMQHRKQVDELEEMLRKLEMRDGRDDFSFYNSGCHQELQGTFALRHRPRLTNPHIMGLMSRYYSKKSVPFSDFATDKVCIEAADVFGNVWELVQYAEAHENNNDDEDETRTREIFYRWDCGYSSYLPPKSGWEWVGDDNHEYSPSRMAAAVGEEDADEDGADADAAGNGEDNGE